MKQFQSIAFMVLFLSIFACSDRRDENTWIVATSADNPPYEFIKDGEIVGFDIDFITEVGRHLGKNVEFKNMDFHSLLAALSSNSVDMVVSGLSITKDRTSRVDFSKPYTDARIAILYRREDNMSRKEDLVKKHVGAQLGTIWSLIGHDLSVNHGFNIKSLASNLMLVEELKLKRLDAIILEESQAMEFKKIYPILDSFPIKEIGSDFAVAMPKNSHLKKNVDYTIKMFKSNGAIKALAKKWGLAGAE